MLFTIACNDNKYLSRLVGAKVKHVRLVSIIKVNNYDSVLLLYEMSIMKNGFLY